MGMPYVSIANDMMCLVQMSGENFTAVIKITTKPGQHTRKPLQTYAILFVPVTSIKVALAQEK